MLNEEQIIQALQLFYEGSKINVGNTVPFIRTYQGNGQISPPDDFNSMMLDPNGNFQYIFYGDITVNLFTDGQNIKEKITLNYFLDVDPNGKPINSLYYAFTFIDNVPESRNFASKGIFAQQILIDNNQMGSISLDGFLIGIQLN